MFWCHLGYQAYQFCIFASADPSDLHPEIEADLWKTTLTDQSGSNAIMAEAKDSRGIEMAQATSHQNDEIDDIKPAAGKIKEVQGDSHFYETVTAAPLSPWSKTSIQLYLILLVAALNATTSGFDGVSSTEPQFV